MEFEVSILHWYNEQGRRHCPCGCYDDPYKVGNYKVSVKTKTMAGYGDPLVEFVVVWCTICGKHEKYTIDDGSTRVSDIRR